MTVQAWATYHLVLSDCVLLGIAAQVERSPSMHVGWAPSTRPGKPSLAGVVFPLLLKENTMRTTSPPRKDQNMCVLVAPEHPLPRRCVWGFWCKVRYFLIG